MISREVMRQHRFNYCIIRLSCSSIRLGYTNLLFLMCLKDGATVVAIGDVKREEVLPGFKRCLCFLSESSPAVARVVGRGQRINQVLSNIIGYVLFYKFILQHLINSYILKQ